MQIKHQTLRILQDMPESRNSDITLMIEIWKRYYSSSIKVNSDGQLGIFLDSLYSLPTQDNIKRVRAIIQNVEGRFLPTEEKIRRQRRINQGKWLEWVRSQGEYQRI